MNIEKMFDPVNNEKFYRSLMLALAFPDWGNNSRILVCKDKTIIELPASEYLQDDSDIIAEFRADGWWNEDTSVYTDGWTKERDDGRYLTDDGRILELSDVIHEAIRDGEWMEEFYRLYKEISRQIKAREQEHEE